MILATASDQTNKVIAIVTLDLETRQLSDVADGLQESELSDPYGLCKYRQGVSLYRQAGGRGYLVLSSQGSNTCAVFEGLGRNRYRYRYRGSFAIGPSGKGIDGVPDTDGSDVSSGAPPGYPQGILVAQDGYNVNPSENQNFKYVFWADVAAQLKLK